jgi:hypothetical protein
MFPYFHHQRWKVYVYFFRRRSQLVVSRYSLAVPFPVSVSIATVSYILLSFFSSRSRVLHRWELYVPFPIFVYLICIFFTFFYALSIKCSSSGGIKDTCSTRCESRINKITMHNSAERSQMRQKCNNARYRQFPLPRNAHAYEWVWQKRVTSELRLGTRPWVINAA